MTTQPKERSSVEALRLADALEADQHGIDLGAEGMGWGPSTATRTQAAAELRRLHAEKERDEALLRQALEAIEKTQRYGINAATFQAITALRERLGEKT